MALYQQRILAGGKARTLAGLSRWDFDDLLRERRIARHYDEENLSDDLDYADRG